MFLWCYGGFLVLCYWNSVRVDEWFVCVKDKGFGGIKGLGEDEVGGMGVC